MQNIYNAVLNFNGAMRSLINTNYCKLNVPLFLDLIFIFIFVLARFWILINMLYLCALTHSLLNIPVLLTLQTYL